MNGQLTIFRIWIHACAIKSAFWYPKTLERWLNGNTFYIEKLQSKTKIMAKNFYKISTMFTDSLFQVFSVIENLLKRGIKKRSNH